MIALLFLVNLACDESPPVAASASPAEVPSATPAATPQTGPRVPVATEHRFAASHILVAFATAMHAPPKVTRTREEARTRAIEVRKKLTDGADFASLAAELSDDSTAARGGSLGSFQVGKMVQPFEDAVRALKPGEVSEPVETPFGFHVIRRDIIQEVHCAQLMIGWAGAPKPLLGVTRSREDAHKRIEAAKAELDGGGEWAVVVRKYTDGPLRDDAGDLGWFAPRQLMPALDTVAFDLEIGATSAVVESPSAFHLIRRLE
ncbi:MAG: hypothetical protein EXR71_20240 [Myxococcales bacterium]|nr:hypothetical protein [Myxococcales bacterium]